MMFYATSDQISLLCPGNEFTERGWSAVARGHAYAGRNRLIQDKVMFEDRSLGTRARVSESETAIAASSPSRRYGQAIEDGVPQLSPFITVAAVGTEASAPSARLRST